MAQHASVDLGEGIAVGLCLSVKDGGAKGAASAGTILDKDWLAQFSRSQLRHSPHLHVGGATGSPGYNQPDCFVRKSRKADTGKGERDGCTGYDRQPQQGTTS
jgi:hypothetical protein